MLVLRPWRSYPSDVTRPCRPGLDASHESTRSDLAIPILPLAGVRVGLSSPEYLQVRACMIE